MLLRVVSHETEESQFPYSPNLIETIKSINSIVVFNPLDFTESRV